MTLKFLPPHEGFPGLPPRRTRLVNAGNSKSRVEVHPASLLPWEGREYSACTLLGRAVLSWRRNRLDRNIERWRIVEVEQVLEWVSELVSFGQVKSDRVARLTVLAARESEKSFFDESQDRGVIAHAV